MATCDWFLGVSPRDWHLELMFRVIISFWEQPLRGSVRSPGYLLRLVIVAILFFFYRRLFLNPRLSVLNLHSALDIISQILTLIGILMVTSFYFDGGKPPHRRKPVGSMEALCLPQRSSLSIPWFFKETIALSIEECSGEFIS